MVVNITTPTDGSCHQRLTLTSTRKRKLKKLRSIDVCGSIFWGYIRCLLYSILILQVA